MPATGSKLAPKAAIKILYGESDEKVLTSNAAEMKKGGHTLTTAIERKGVIEALRGDKFDLVILGSTLSKDDRHHLPYMVAKANEETKVLVMHAGTHHHEVDVAVDSGISMGLLLEKIAALMQPTGAR